MVLETTGRTKAKKRFLILLRSFSYLGTCFFLLSVVQFMFSLTFLKNNHVYFDFFSMICYSLYLSSFFLDSIVMIDTNSSKFHRRNLYYFIFSFLLLIKAYFIIFKTSSDFINLQIRVCYYNNKFGSFINMGMDLLDFLLFCMLTNN